jgi:hypothetical protein
MATTKVTTDNIDLSGNTGALEVPTGTTAQRPGSFGVDFLVVAGGGGGGGWFRGGGGGAGGLRTSYGSTSGGGSSAETQLTLVESTNYTVTVGAGGAGGVYQQNGTNGDDSQFGTVTSKGGGGGSYYGTVNANAGGSGGGSAGYTSTTGSPGAGETNQGFAGGQGQAGNPQSGGGGGGAGAVGQAGGGAATSGDGGDGINSLILPYTEAGTAGVGEQISGSEVWYAGGGGSGGYELGNDSIPGKGGGGEGGWTVGAPYADGSSGTDGTGGGGGGSGGSTGYAGTGGTGGKGVVILRYPSSATLSKTGTLTESTGSPFTEGSDKISVFTSGDGTVSFADASNSATEGEMRENTTTGKMEIYTGSTGWRALQQTGQDVGINPSSNFNTVLYTGDSSTQAITVGFKPDWVIVKSRTQGYEPTVFDTVRGALERIRTSSSTSEDTKTGSLTSFDTNGFTTGNYAGMNNSGQSFVAWCWKAGGNSNTFNKDGTGYATATAAGLTTGTITPTGSSVGTETGFSIIKYTANGVVGATIPHGLGAAPDLYIIKALDSTRNWVVGTWMIPNTTILQLDLDAAVATYDAWDSTYPDANNVTVSAANTVNASGDYIMYCFRSIPGYSQIGFYNGTDVTSGNKIYTGFKPAWLMVRNISTSKYWYIVDNKRSTTNPRNKELYFNVDDTEATMDSVSFFDYGFELVTTDSGYNDIGNKYLFMAFSE